MPTTSPFNVRIAQQILAYYGSRDEQLLEPLFADLRPYLSSYVAASLPRLDAERRQDLVQETCTNLLRALRKQLFKGVANEAGQVVGFLAYAKTTCRRLHLRQAGSLSDKPSKPNAAEDSLRHVVLAVSSEGFYEETQAQELLAAATAAVLGLPSQVRDCVLLVYYQGLTPESAAAQLGLTLHRFTSRLSLGIRLLQSWAAHHRQGPPPAEVYAALPRIDTGDLFREPLRLAG